jgi:hypothetical protein
LGVNAGFHLRNGNYNIYLGNTARESESNTMRLGQGAVTYLGRTSGIVSTFIAGIWGATTPPVVVSGKSTAPVSVFVNANGQLGTIASSARYKRDIQDMRESSQGLYQLRPVTFRYKQDTQGQRQYGLIAEEVAKVYPELVVWGAKGEVESVQYHELIPMLLNEIQRQQQKLDAQAQELAELKAQARQVAEVKAENACLQAVVGQMQQRDEEHRAQNAALAARLERLEAGAARVATAASR